MSISRKLQVLWSGHLDKRQVVQIVDDINIINTAITPIRSIIHGLQLLTSSGDTVVPCNECLARGITETISYVDLRVTAKLGEAAVEATIYVLCNGCPGHGGIGKYCIVFYADAI